MAIGGTLAKHARHGAPLRLRIVRDPVGQGIEPEERVVEFHSRAAIAKHGLKVT